MPQDSVSGPILFLLLTNDLRTYLLAGECQTVIYADDTVITPVGKTNERLTGNVHDVYIKQRNTALQTA